jgi:hypothetical protein
METTTLANKPSPSVAGTVAAIRQRSENAHRDRARAHLEQAAPHGVARYTRTVSDAAAEGVREALCRREIARVVFTEGPRGPVPLSPNVEVPGLLAPVLRDRLAYLRHADLGGGSAHRQSYGFARLPDLIPFTEGYDALALVGVAALDLSDDLAVEGERFGLGDDRVRERNILIDRLRATNDVAARNSHTSVAMLRGLKSPLTTDLRLAQAAAVRALLEDADWGVYSVTPRGRVRSVDVLEQYRMLGSPGAFSSRTLPSALEVAGIPARASKTGGSVYAMCDPRAREVASLFVEEVLADA